MIAFIIKALTSRAAGPIGAAVAVALGLALAFAHVQLGVTRAALKAAEAKVERTETDLRTCRGNVAGLRASLDAQNAALTAMERDGKARAAEVAKARQATRQEAERADRAVVKLAALEPVGNDLCARMLAVDEAVKEATR